MLESLDEQILKQLQRDGRVTNQQLADRVGASPSACWRRIKNLEKIGVIGRYAALVDRARAGFATAAIIHVTLDRHDTGIVNEFTTQVRDRPEVLECFATTGDADYHLRVVVRDINAYNQFLESFIFKLPGVRHVRTNMILKEIKADVSLPF